MSDMGQSIQTAAAAVRHGGLLVYPTEAVYGIGCDYRNQQAVEKLLNLKQRSVKHGLILIAGHVQQVLPLIKPTDRSHLARALKTWPGHHTWVFPASDLTPDWITGNQQSVAVRVSGHPPVQALCAELNHALVSTSANLSGHDTPTSMLAIQQQWSDEVDYYLDLPLGSQPSPSQIRRADDGQVLR